MIQYIISYLSYITAILIAFAYGKLTGVIVRFPIKAVIFLPLSCPFTSAALGFEVMAAYMDKEYDMNVYDIYHICAGMMICIEFIYKILKGTFVFSMINIYDCIPIIFIILTVFTRGLSDTLAMIVYAMSCLIHYINPLYIIMGFLLGHVIQIIIQYIYCKRKNIKYKEKPALPFLPALYVGSSMAIFAGINTMYINTGGII